MKKNEYARMAEHEQSYWWHLGRLKIIEQYVKKATKKVCGQPAILNVGAGIGGTLPMLEKYGTVKNVDISDDAIKYLKGMGYKDIVKIDGIKLPFKSGTYDMVGAFDVLEHIKEEDAALQEWGRVIKDDGAIVITVPAYQWLWSDHDVSLHHQRRYTVKRLVAAAEKANLRAETRSYAIVFSLPMIVGFRFLNKALGKSADSETSYVPVPKFVNTLFTGLLRVEASLHGKVRFPFGTSVVVTLRKK